MIYKAICKIEADTADYQAQSAEFTSLNMAVRYIGDMRRLMDRTMKETNGLFVAEIVTMDVVKSVKFIVD